jgi:UDP-glucose 4-epimerase
MDVSADESDAGLAMSNVLVTGGAGYIGSHTAYALLDRGENVVVLDNLSTGVRSLVSEKADFINGDVADRTLLRQILTGKTIDAIIHFAGSIVVPESVEQPLRYYANNTLATHGLIEEAIAAGVGRFVFSSTAAVYGQPEANPIPEASPLNPMSPYGRSKLMTEWMLEDASRASHLRYVALRYFNVAGADPKGRTGQSTPRATHLIKRAAQAVLGRIPHLEIFGTDYATRDGTGVRDYIHVSDLAEAHLLALDALRGGADSSVYNCGYGHGTTVREIVSTMEKVSGKQLPTRESPRRAGDPPALVADPAKIKSSLRWQPRHDDLETIVRSALEWERRFNS